MLLDRTVHCQGHDPSTAENPVSTKGHVEVGQNLIIFLSTKMWDTKCSSRKWAGKAACDTREKGHGVAPFRNCLGDILLVHSLSDV